MWRTVCILHRIFCVRDLVVVVMYDLTPKMHIIIYMLHMIIYPLHLLIYTTQMHMTIYMPRIMFRVSARLVVGRA